MISEKKEARSEFVTYLSVKNNTQINNELIFPKARKFFDVRNIKNPQSIAENDAIASYDFKTVKFSYLYDVIFNDISKKEGKIEIPIKYCITLDKRNCEKTCEKTGMLYDEILLYKQPVFYFLYINIEEIFEFLHP